MPGLPRPDAQERGSSLVVVLVLALVSAGMLSTLMGRNLVEQRHSTFRHAQERAFWRARGELELGMRKVARSTYSGGTNDVLRNAVQADDRRIDGTAVLAEQIPGTRWHRLTARSDFGDTVGRVRALLRDGLAYVAYNYYVENGNLGVSGRPRGRIHTNEKLQFLFPEGTYDGYVSAGDSFEFLNGATPENTHFLGGSDGSADRKSLLQNVDYDALRADAVLVGTADQYARVHLQGDQVRVRLYREPYTVEVEETRYESVYVGDELQDVTRSVYVGDASVAYDHPIYRTESQLVSVRHEELVWVEFADGGTGTDVYGGSGASGYWETNVWYEDEWQDVQVLDHYETRYRMEPQYEDVTEQEWVAVYEEVPYVETVTVTISNELVHDQTYPSNGLFYFAGRIKDIEGDLRGHVTLVTESYAEIDDHIRYVDADGDRAYQNGTDPSLPYEPNPDFDRDHSFAVVAQGNIYYDRYVPTSLEINGSLISTGGMVGYEGISIGSDGTPYRSSSRKTRLSLRRFGSIMSWFQPVSTFLDEDGQIEHGFLSGSSVFDSSLLMSPPPGTPTEEIPVLWVVHRLAPPGQQAVGREQPPTGFTEVTALRGDALEPGPAPAPGLTWGGAH